MKIKIKFILLLFGLKLYSISLISQELNCSIEIIPPQVNVGDEQVYEQMKKDIFEFMNNQKWTNDIFSIEERIECSILITINKRLSVNDFEGTMQITSRRPVYNSSYYSTIFNYNDKDIKFRYIPFQPLQFSKNTHLSNLTSLLAFYAYYIIGLDYDTFSLEGGTKYFQIAQQIVSNAQSAPEKGWKSFESDRNRYWLIDNTLNQVFKPLRECYYIYHRKGLDEMYKDINTARQNITNALMILEKVHNIKPLSFNMQLFFNAKTDEIISIYKKASPQEKQKISVLLSKIDPARTREYQDIMKNK